MTGQSNLNPAAKLSNIRVPPHSTEEGFMKSFREHFLSPKRTAKIELIIEKRGDERVVSRMPVTDGIRNPYGTVHAGAMFWLADVTATVLAVGKTEVGEDGRGFPLVVDVHMALLRNQREGELVAEATVLRRGRRIIVVKTQVRGKDNLLLAEVTTTHVPA